jgi:hypothetical protein
MPRQFSYRGDRLAFSIGIIALGLLAVVLIVAFAGSVTNLIPLYTVGVFVAFTLSQTGMVLRWWRRRTQERHWYARATVNGLGATATGVVAVVVGLVKFALGAWMVMVLIPILILLMLAIHRHYRGVAQAMAFTPARSMRLPASAPRVIVPVSRLDRAAYRALQFARTLSSDILPVHVSDTPADAEAIQRQWDEWDTGLELVIVESPYRSLLPPLLAYIDAIREADLDQNVVVVVAEFVPRHFWQNFLHNQAALRLKVHLFSRPNVVVVDVPTREGQRV